MTLTKLTRWSLCATVMAVGVGVAVGAAETRTASAETAQAMTCAWKASSSAGTAVYHAAGAVDKNGKAYILGGLNQDGKAQQTAQAMDMSATNPTTLAGSKADPLRNMTQRRWGAAAAYRPSSDPAKAGRIYVFGGASDDIDYAALLGATPPASMVIQGEDSILQYDIDADSWTAITNAGSIGNRMFAAAAYSPQKDAILLVGGMKSCDFKKAVVDGQGCQADQFTGQWLKFDATTGNPTTLEAEGGGPTRVYGHTAVYDADHAQIIVAGGTSSGNNSVSTVEALDVSSATGTWKGLPNMMRGLSFHSAAYAAALKHMVVHGGTNSDFFRLSESTNQITYGLDLSGATAKWSDLKATGASPATRVGAVMGYVTNAGGLMHAVMSTGRSRLQSANQSPARSNEVLVCGAPVTPVPTTPGATTPVPTTPGGGTPTPVTPTPTIDPTGNSCPGLEAKAPSAAINAALASQASIGGYGMACNPNVPMNPVSNPLRTRLSLRNVNVPYHPVYNGFILKCGCP